MNTTTKDTQSFTLATAVNLGSEWTLAEIRTLECLKAGNMSIKDIATQLGRSYYSVTNKLLSLGLTHAHRKSNSPKTPIEVCSSCFTTPSASGVCFC